MNVSEAFFLFQLMHARALAFGVAEKGWKSIPKALGVSMTEWRLLRKGWKSMPKALGVSMTLKPEPCSLRVPLS